MLFSHNKALFKPSPVENLLDDARMNFSCLASLVLFSVRAMVIVRPRHHRSRY